MRLRAGGPCVGGQEQLEESSRGWGVGMEEVFQ